MSSTTFDRVLEHHNWANAQILQACAALTDGQLDAEPQSATQGSIRSTLHHLVQAQAGYLRLLTLPVEERRSRLFEVQASELAQVAQESGEALLALVRDEADSRMRQRLETTSGYLVEAWVVLLQVINHATEHREQIKSMLSALEVEPPGIDGWDYGKATGAAVAASE